MSAAQTVQSLVEAHRNAWRSVVAVAYAVKPEDIDREVEVLAADLGATKAALLVKFRAIQHKREQGWTEEAITRAGQGATLSAYAASKKRDRTETDVILRYRIPESLYDAWMELQGHLSRTANLRTSEEFIEFLYSCLVDATPEEIRHHAGMIGAHHGAKIPQTSPREAPQEAFARTSAYRNQNQQRRA